jgi:hypothetical protein
MEVKNKGQKPENWFSKERVIFLIEKAAQVASVATLILKLFELFM